MHHGPFALQVECLTAGCGYVVTLDAGEDLPPGYVCPQCRQPPQLARGAASAADQVYLDNGTVPCSGCGAPIEKNGGCDKLHCRCGAYTCWGCGEALDARRPYAHFRGEGTYRCGNGAKRKQPRQQQPRQPRQRQQQQAQAVA